MRAAVGGSVGGSSAFISSSERVWLHASEARALGGHGALACHLLAHEARHRVHRVPAPHSVSSRDERQGDLQRKGLRTLSRRGRNRSGRRGPAYRRSPASPAGDRKPPHSAMHLVLAARAVCWWLGGWWVVAVVGARGRTWTRARAALAANSRLSSSIVSPPPHWIRSGGSPARSPKSGEAAAGSASPRYSEDQWSR